MTYSVVPFQRWHIGWLIEAGVSEDGPGVPLTNGVLTCMEQENSWTILLDNEPLMSAGTMRQWSGRHMAWAYLNKKSGQHMNYITKKTKEVLRWPKGRIEITVRRDFSAGHRWARMLGFQVENFPGVEVEKLPPDMEPPSLLQKYGPAGEDHIAYVQFVK